MIALEQCVKFLSVEFIKDILFPKICAGCGSLGNHICLDCQNKLVYIKRPTCLYCGRGSLYGLTHEKCKRKNGVDGLFSIFYYNNIVRRIIKNAKYRLAQEVLSEFLQTINLSRSSSFDFLIYIGDSYCQSIPLHKKRLRERGFNQADLISDFLTRLYKFKKIDAVDRVRMGLPQAQLKKEKRFANIRGVFKLKNDLHLKGKTILLIDDVATTGSTVKEAGMVLKRNEAAKVYVFTLAKG